MNFEIIVEQERLRQVCELVSQKPYLMVDTEFVRTRTLYPRLGLIQIYDGDILALIDPIALEDMTPFWQVLQNKNVTKVLHACGEDLEVFQHYADCMPTPMLDTQVMASFLGYGMSAGFGSLVKDFLGIDLDKGEARTDWMARPLSNKQLNYAAADVFYLLPLFEKIKQEVEKVSWWEAVELETQLVMEKRQRQVDPEKAYLDIKNAWQLRPRQLAVLQQAAKWRLLEAQKRDLALNFVVKELNLWKLARYNLRSREQLEKEGFERMEIQRHGNRLLKMVYDADGLNEADLPAPITRLVDMPGYKQIFKLLKDQIKEVSEQTGLATEFLASKKQLNQLLSWDWKYNRSADALPDVLSGWRKELLEERLLKVLERSK
ncbi:ribonuclease D [Vibrio sp. Of7-15]|uniref:ribonuclease D n=1 Tax=Vibrio sp. Of7-15 TaxID=2724879 RepID=UPI001EF2FF84|nr:ribonuclease D [Vibrio sp. Of7-15]